MYSDDVEQFIDEGRVGFEIRIGQGAKPGLGGVIKILRNHEILHTLLNYYPTPLIYFVRYAKSLSLNEGCPFVNPVE